MATDWDALHRRLWAAVKAHSARVGETAEEYTRAISEAVRAAGGALTPEAEQLLTDYLDAGDGLIREGVERAVAPLADVESAVAAMRSETIARAVDEAYTRRWPDGLRLSDRVWRWQEETRAGVSRVLADGVRVGRGIEGIMMDMQRSIEAVSGERFNIQTALGPDWVDDLSAAAKGYIKSPAARMGWNAVVREAQAKVASLKVGGTRRQAEHALEQIGKAVQAGREDLVDQALRWWTYDRQQYALKRIVRTEMATAHHRAVIAASQDDPDVTGYRWRLSPSHPEPDICDYYADIELGLGKGVWPKDQVPRAKAHPHCMCSLTPTTRKMRKDGVRGETDLEGLKARMGERERAGFEAQSGGAGVSPAIPGRDAPAPAATAAGPGTPGTSRRGGAPTVAGAGRGGIAGRGGVPGGGGDGLTPGPSREAAAAAIRRAAQTAQWTELKIKPGARQTRETLDALRANVQVQEVADYLADLDRNGYRTNSRQWHYFRYRYAYADPLNKPEELDERFDRVLADRESAVHVRTGRFVVVSRAEGRLAYVRQDGARLSVYRYNDDDLARLGDPQWTLTDLEP